MSLDHIRGISAWLVFTIGGTMCGAWAAFLIVLPLWLIKRMLSQQ